MMNQTHDTRDLEYAEYLIQNQKSPVSQILQTPYRWHLKVLKLGRTLDIGCGAGRNLAALPSSSVGIDHNEALVKACKKRGLSTFTTEDFLNRADQFLREFDSILISHVAEHMTLEQFTAMLNEYAKFLKPHGRIVVICPQEKGYASDSTHVFFMTFESISNALKNAGLTVQSQYSFPFPRWVGRFFRSNEFIVIGQQ